MAIHLARIHYPLQYTRIAPGATASAYWGVQTRTAWGYPVGSHRVLLRNRERERPRAPPPVDGGSTRPWCVS